MIKINLITSIYQGTLFKGATRSIVYLKQSTINKCERVKCENDILIVNEYFIDAKEALERYMELYKYFKNIK